LVDGNWITVFVPDIGNGTGIAIVVVLGLDTAMTIVLLATAGIEALPDSS